MPDEAKRILDSAKAFKKSLKRRADYHDYERFKHQLWDAGMYGYEPILADILGV